MNAESVTYRLDLSGLIKYNNEDIKSKSHFPKFFYLDELQSLKDKFNIEYCGGKIGGHYLRIVLTEKPKKVWVMH